MKILSPACSWRFWKMSITLKPLISYTHWYWQDVAQEIVECHLGSAEALPSFKFWKSENIPISWTEWNILINFCVNILLRSCPKDCEMTFFIGRGFAELQILKKWKWLYLLNSVRYCDEILHTHWYGHDVAHEIVKWHLGLVEVLPRFKFWKQWLLTLKPFGILW